MTILKKSVFFFFLDIQRYPVVKNNNGGEHEEPEPNYKSLEREVMYSISKGFIKFEHDLHKLRCVNAAAFINVCVSIFCRENFF